MFAGATDDFLGAHRYSGTIHSQVHGGSHFACLVHLVLFRLGDLGPQCVGGSFRLLGADLHPANSWSSPELSSKLTSVAVLAVMRKTPGVKENNPSPSARSRGQNPLWHGLQ